MTLFSSLYIGASGLAANSLDLSVVGDNIANSNTIGFKGSRAAFEDVLGQNLIGGSGELGMGARLQAVQKLLQQGAITSTGIATDLAIQGNGFFQVKGPDGPLYTRAGNFTLDQSGFLVNLDGLRVQGFAGDVNGVLGRSLSDLQLADATTPPKATTSAVVRANLDSGASVLPPFDINDVSGTSNFSTSVTVFDSLGASHQVDLHFRKAADGSWEWHAVTDGSNVDGGTAGTPVEIGGGTMTFDGDGNLVDATGTAVSFDPAGAAGAQTINFDLGDPTSTGGTGAAGIVQQAGTSAVRFLSQDGFSAGTLAGVKVDEQGNVVGTFTNGETRTLAQVALADFPAADQLERVGGNLYRALPDAGDVNVGAPGSGGRGTIVAGALEQSNVDLASEFVRMIVAQRSFQANSKTMTTADSLLAELIQIKR